MIGASTRHPGPPNGHIDRDPKRQWLRHWYYRLFLAAALMALAWVIDRPVALWSIDSAENGPKWLSDFRHATQQFGETMGVVLVLLAIWWLDRARRRPFVLVAACVLLVGGIAAGAKLIPGRERPKKDSDGRIINVWRGPVKPGEMTPDPSFPSGHTTAAFAFALCLCRLYPKGSPSFILLAALCALSRILSGRHFVTDTIAGAWIGWEAASLLWESRIGGFATFVDRFLPRSSSYPGWNWDRMEPAVAKPSDSEAASKSETERREGCDPVHSLV